MNNLSKYLVLIMLVLFIVFSMTGVGFAEDNIKIGFANMADSIDFCMNVKKGIIEEAEKRDWEVVAVDNELDGQKAVRNTDYLIQQEVDIVLMYNIDASTQPVIAEKLENAGIPAIAIDIFLPGFPFFGVNNTVVGEMAGSYLAYYSKFVWNRDPDLFVILDNPQGGKYAKVRSDGTENGFMKVYPSFPEEKIVRVDAKADVLPAKEAMSGVLTANPNAEYIIVTGINDQVNRGALVALEQSDRDDNSVIVSLGADGSFLEKFKETKGKGALKAAVTFGPELYGKYMMPLVKKLVEGEEIPERNYVESFLVDKQSIKTLYPEYAW